MLWILFIFLTVIAWGGYDVLVKVAEGKINSFAALLIVGIAQVLVAIPFVLYQKTHGGVFMTARGITVTAIMGAGLGLGTIFFFYAFKSGAPVSIAIAVYSVGVALLGAIAGIAFFNDPFNFIILTGTSSLPS